MDTIINVVIGAGFVLVILYLFRIIQRGEQAKKLETSTRNAHSYALINQLARIADALERRP